MDTPPLALTPPRTRPALGTVAEFLKPITWFPPMWAFACGVVASGQNLSEQWGLLLLGLSRQSLYVKLRRFGMVAEAEAESH